MQLLIFRLGANCMTRLLFNIPRGRFGHGRLRVGRWWGAIFRMIILTVQAGPIMRYMEATAASLHQPWPYVQGVLSAPQAPGEVD